MKFKCFIFSVSFFFLFSNSGIAQIEKKDYALYTIKDGLSHSSITALAQDRFGYMWIGTEQGLNRFDGLGFKQFYSDKSKESLPSEDILNLQWIDSNNLAVVTRLGLNIINIETMRQSSLIVPGGVLKEENRVNRLRGLLTDEKGNFFLATRTGFYHFNSKKELVFRYDDYTREQLETNGGGFGIFLGWLDDHNVVVTGQHGAYHYNVDLKRFVKITGSHPLFSVFSEINRLGDRNYIVWQPWPGKFIIFIYDSDTAIYIDEQKKLLTYSRLNLFPLDKEVSWRSNLFVLEDSSLLFSGKNSGIFRLSLQRNTGKLLLDTNKFFNKHKYNDCIIDKDNQIWFASNEGFLIEKKNSVNLQVMKLPDSIVSGNPSSIIQAVADENSIYAAGTLSGAFYIFKKKEMSFDRKVPIASPQKRENSSYTIIKLGNDTVLCGGIAGLLWYNVKNKTNGFFDLPGWDSKHSWIANIFEDSRKNLWVTTNKGDGYYFRGNNTGKFKWLPYKQVLVKAIQTIWRMAEDSHGNIWMGGNGLARYNIKKEMFDMYVDSFPVIRIHEKGISALAIDKADNIWLGNTSNGLILFEPEKNIFTDYTRADGLPHNSVVALKITDSTLWIACKTGIARMNLKNRKIFNAANSKDLLYNDISGNTLFQDSSTGMIYAGIGSQLVGFNTDGVLKNEIHPHLLIENVSIGNDSVIWNPAAIFHTKWKNKNISVTFNSVNYNDPQDQRYAYRIVNRKKSNWILLEEQRRIVFSDLNSGSYRIEVKVYSANNRWEPQFLRFTIIINPPFWKTWWFYLLCILVVSFVVYMLFRYRINQLKRVIEVRSKISQDLHDEVGSTLSGIAMYSHLTKEQINKQQIVEVEKSLNIIQQSATDMVNRLSDIVWVVNPQHDSLQKLIQKLEEYATEMAVVKGIKIQADTQASIAEVRLPMQSRRNIYLICKEAINNAIKYSQATRLELNVHAFDHSVEFSIKDNGKGFDAATVKKGNGLENMQKRADEIGAKLLLQSKENEGASVSLQCKIT